MPRPSKIDRLPPETQELISRLRREGRTIDEILAKLRELLPAADLPSRTGLGKRVKKIEALSDRIRTADAIADRLVGVMGEGSEDKLLRANARLLGSALFDLLAGADDGETVVLEPKDAKALSETLRNLSTTQKNSVEFTIKLEQEADRKAKTAAVKAAETVGREKGLSVDTINAIKAQILGVRTAS